MPTFSADIVGTPRSRLLLPLLGTLLIIGWSSGFVGVRYASE